MIVPRYGLRRFSVDMRGKQASGRVQTEPGPPVRGVGGWREGPRAKRLEQARKQMRARGQETT